MSIALNRVLISARSPDAFVSLLFRGGLAFRLSIFRVSLTFRPDSDENAILLYCAQNARGIGDFIALIVYKRRLKLLIGLGVDMEEVYSNRTLEIGRWYHVSLSKEYKMISLTLDSEASVRKTYSKPLHPIALKTFVYFGGIDRRKISLNKNIKVKLSFQGCLDKMRIHNSKYDSLKSLSGSSNIEECDGLPRENAEIEFFSTAPATRVDSTVRPDYCTTKPCVHGVCQNTNFNDFSCTCEYGFVGRNCENMIKQCELLSPCLNGGSCTDTRASYKCDCRYGFIGQNCSKAKDICDDANFHGDGWIELSNSVMTHEDEQELIGFEISTNETNGLIMWHGDTKIDKRISKHYIALAVIDGFVEFQYSLGSGPAILRISTLRVDDGARHRIILERSRREGSIELDGEHVETGTSDGLNDQLEISGNVFIGGVPDYSITLENYFAGFSGCIHALEVQDSGAIDMGKYVLRGRNVSPCPRPKISVPSEGKEISFDEVDAPPPVNIMHPKPTSNRASASFGFDLLRILFDEFVLGYIFFLIL